MERDDEAIARQEADETFQSISDLDNITDTMFVAITFLLTAIATWTGFTFERVADTPFLETLYVALVVTCTLTIAASVFYLASSLAPRGFYGSAVGRNFLDHRWLLWRNENAVDVETYRRRRLSIEDESDLRSRYEEWLDEYDPGTDLTSRESFEFSRLLNYKFVARTKAKNTAYGIALMRIAVILFILIIVVTLTGPLFV